MTDRLHIPPLPQPPPSASVDAPSTPATAAPSPSDSKKSAPAPAPATAPEPDTVVVPTYSSWFTWNGIHEVEMKNMTEFFEGKSPSKNPNVYKYYRNAIVKKYRSNSSRKLTFTEVRRTVVGDVGSIRRVFDFLETWGLVNYSPPPTGKYHNKSEDKESKSVSAAAAANAAANAAIGGEGGGGSVETNANSNQKSRKWCSGCKAVCTIACFVSDKYDIVLCARCYVRGNYREGLSSSEFRRVEISETSKTEWTDKETLHLLEAVMQYGDDWKRVAEHVAGRSEKDCVARFIKLPFGEQFLDPVDLSQEEDISCQINGQNNTKCGAEPDAKKMRLTPLADASNPIMAQAAFLSALAGVEVSEAASQAAVSTLYDMAHLTSRGSGLAFPSKEQGNGGGTSDKSSLHASEEARIIAERQLKQEEDEFVKSISTITEVKIKQILEKISRFEEMDCQLEKDWQEWHQMKDQLFLDKLSLLFHKAALSQASESGTEENVDELPTTSS